MARQAAASRPPVIRRAAARILSRGRGAVIGAELERILYHQPCGRCGAWRCPYCRQLAVTRADHRPWCRYAPPARRETQR